MTAVDRIRWHISARAHIDRHVALVEASELFDRAFYSRKAGRIFDGDGEAIRHYLLKGDQNGVEPNALFDGAHYRRRYPDIVAEGINPLIHYVLHGAAELRDPHPLFHAEYYVSTQTDHEAACCNPLHHFLHVDADPLRSPHPLFVGDYYRDHNSDLAGFDRPLFFHFLEHGGYEVRAFHPLFDVKYYAQRTTRDPARHVLEAFLAGPRQTRPHYLFDADFYLRTNPDVARVAINPLLHYALLGSRERRPPHPVFDQSWYIDRHPEAARARETTLGHYVRHGQACGHRPNRWFDDAWYAETHAASLGDRKPIEHYVTTGLALDLQPSPAFDPAYYLETNPDVAAAGQPAFAHFMEHGRFERRRGLDPKAKAVAGRFAIVLHLFYLDLLPEIESYLKPLEGMVDILVSVPRERRALFEPIVKTAFPSATVVPVENRGRDIGALFELAGQIDLSGYTAVCKLHTKKGITERDVWRHMMLRCLVGSPAIVEQICDAFRASGDLWVVGPADFHISTRRFIGPNAKGVLSLFAEMYPHAWPDFDWGFFAGTMFWFRPAAIERLSAAIGKAQAPGHAHAFDEERLANDGGVAHSIERLFLVACAIEGKLVGRVAYEPGDGEPRLQILPPTEGISRDEPADTLARFAHILDGKVRRSLAPPAAHRLLPVAARKLDPAVNLIGPLPFLNGLGTSARAYLALLRESGVDVNAVAWGQGFERLSRIEGMTLPVSAKAAAINIVHMNLDLLRAGAFLETGALSQALAKARHNILVFYWELPTLKPEWVPLLRRFDEVWCPTTFIRDMVQAVCDVPTRLLRPDLGAATRRESKRPLEADRAFIGLPEDRFAFAYFADGGSIMQRKNPETLVRAFVEEFDEDEMACCYLKIHYPGEAAAALERLRAIVGGRKDVVLSGALYDDAEMQVLFQSIDCYVSPHRSEGLGLTIIEAMQNGKPVIATPFGGSSDFVAEAHAYPLDYTLIEVGPGCEPYPEHFVWADPTIASLRRQMRAVFEDRRGAQVKAEAAREAVRRMVEENRAATREVFALEAA